MPNWSHVLDLQRRSRDNALYAAAALHQRRLQSLEAERATAAAAQASIRHSAHREPPGREVSPDLPSGR